MGVNADAMAVVAQKFGISGQQQFVCFIHIDQGQTGQRVELIIHCCSVLAPTEWSYLGLRRYCNVRRPGHMNV